MLQTRRNLICRFNLWLTKNDIHTIFVILTHWRGRVVVWNNCSQSWYVQSQFGKGSGIKCPIFLHCSNSQNDLSISCNAIMSQLKEFMNSGNDYKYDDKKLNTESILCFSCRSQNIKDNNGNSFNNSKSATHKSY